jgi:uncharacterized protein (TIGR02246 family)
MIANAPPSRLAKLPALAATLALCLVTSCATSPATRAKDEARARGEVVAAMERYMELLRLGPVDALVAYYTADAELLEPGMISLRGREAIRAFLEPIFAQAVVESASTETETIDVHGNSACQWGTYHQRVAAKDKPAVDYAGRYVAAWRREADKKWRLTRLLVQPSPQGSP